MDDVARVDGVTGTAAAMVIDDAATDVHEEGASELASVTDHPSRSVPCRELA